MQIMVFSVFDSKAAAYLQPMFFQSKGVAIRAFCSAVSDPKHDFSRFAEDFTLFELGSFDDATAIFKMHMTPISLGKASEFKSNQSDVSVG